MNPFEKCLDGQSEMLVACATMLEKYVSKYPQTKGNVKFNDEDMKLWKEKFYPSLVESGPQLPDNLFFDPSGKNKDIAIGKDGEFSATELFQFLYRVYKALYEVTAMNKGLI